MIKKEGKRYRNPQNMSQLTPEYHPKMTAEDDNVPTKLPNSCLTSPISPPLAKVYSVQGHGSESICRAPSYSTSTVIALHFLLQINKASKQSQKILNFL